MRATIGLVALGLIGGVAPTGLAGIAHAGQVLAGTAGALLFLIVCCLAGAAAARVATPTIAPVVPRRPRSPIASPRSAPRSI